MVRAKELSVSWSVVMTLNVCILYLSLSQLGDLCCVSVVNNIIQSIASAYPISRRGGTSYVISINIYIFVLTELAVAMFSVHRVNRAVVY